jgi:hypothetical protein
VHQHVDGEESQNDCFSLDWIFESYVQQKEVGFSSICAPILGILLNYPRFDGIYWYVDSCIMLELYTSKCVMQELVYISYF